ncbi:hypothetical protein AB0M86_32740 [Streptomyces sp. NPDC051639]|uniref:hypothetical protein n=1 Tax=unclassified Streptomyces TaxID=2593676 RepID=UPI002001D927|nr:MULTISPECIES: hypothetical protein [unclassified Streptomyces]
MAAVPREAPGSHLADTLLGASRATDGGGAPDRPSALGTWVYYQVAPSVVAAMSALLDLRS